MPPNDVAKGEYCNHSSWIAMNDDTKKKSEQSSHEKDYRHSRTVPLKDESRDDINSDTTMITPRKTNMSSQISCQSSTPSLTLTSDDDPSIESRESSILSKQDDDTLERDDRTGMDMVHTPDMYNRYPSGRLALVPLDKARSNSLCDNYDDDNNATKKKDGKRKFSWLGGSLCAALHAVDDSVTHQQVDPLPEEQPVMNEPVHLSEDVIYSNSTDNDIEVGSYGEEIDYDGDLDYREDRRLNESGEIQIQSYSGIRFGIDHLLAGSGLWCNSWQDWYAEETAESRLEYAVRRTSYNRATNLSSRKKRVQSLRMDLYPFGLEQTDLHDCAINGKRYAQGSAEKRNRSFSNVYDSTGGSDDHESPRPWRGRFAMCADDAYCAQQASGSHRKLDADLCYDSDPSDIISTNERRQQKRAANMDIMRQSSSSSSEGDFSKVQELLTSKKTLVWHHATNHTNSKCTTAAIKAWIELGSQLQSALIQPKLMWQESHSKNMTRRENSVLSNLPFHAVELLDISGIFILKSVDRSLYPFARKSCSFIVKSFDMELLFEASCTEERDQIVEGLKLMVARLGSKIICGDGDVLREFFNPLGASVPGEAPQMAFLGGDGQQSVQYQDHSLL